MHSTLGRVLAALSAWVIATLPVSVAAQTGAAAAARPITIGESITVQSTVLGEARTIDIYLPPDYANGGERYPVLYLLDGGLDQDFLHVLGTTQLGAVWGRSRPAIVVGIASRDRRRELAGPTTDRELLQHFPTAGNSAAFRRHIAEEVKPLIEGRYRTNGDDAVLGESLAGLFIVETWLRQPDLFDRYAAISPSLWWDNEQMRRVASEQLARPGAARPRILLAPDDEGPEMAAIAARFLATLPLGGSVCHAPQRYNHANIYHAITPMALQFLFPPAEPPMAEFGFVVSCTPGA